MQTCFRLKASPISRDRKGYRKNTVLLVLGIIMVPAIIGLSFRHPFLGNQELMELKFPSNFPAPIYDFQANPVTKQGFELGKKLFYDPLLSRDGTISCGTCHIQASAFTHHSHDVSHGIDDQLGVRNSPPIMNLAWSRFFFWDGGVFNMDLQPIGPIENPVEMDEHLPKVIEKLQKNKEYRQLFNKAFGEGPITSANMLKAFSQFMAACISANSKYDKVVRNEGEQFTEPEARGRQVFQSKCASCHSTDLFTDNEFHNNGLPPNDLNDSGRYRISLDPKDFHLFKTPSLRNVAVTGPYMHDGRFETLDEVFEHYENGVLESSTLDNKLKTTNKMGIPLSAEERVQLKYFLNTLTDREFIKNPILSEH